MPGSDRRKERQKYKGADLGGKPGRTVCTSYIFAHLRTSSYSEVPKRGAKWNRHAACLANVRHLIALLYETWQVLSLHLEVPGKAWYISTKICADS